MQISSEVAFSFELYFKLKFISNEVAFCCEVV